VKGKKISASLGACVSCDEQA